MPTSAPAPVETIPTGAELDYLWRRLADAAEDLEQMFKQVCRVVNGPEPVPATFADVGRLVNFMHEAKRLTVEPMGETLNSLQQLVVVDLAAIVHEGGSRDSVPHYDEHGMSNYPEKGGE